MSSSVKNKGSKKTVSRPDADTIKNRKPAERKAEKLSAGFPVVGIGASAGGLAAFEAFFSAMPAAHPTAIAFVLVQHLAPDHKSMLTDLIKRYTPMEVFEVADGMKIQANCAYIIPPNRDMALLGNKLQLLEPSAPRGHRLPIDFFFSSLAEEQREQAICIILSGTGSDGTQGVRAIKAAGGMAMAQIPNSAEFDGMPRSAINSGLVDYQLPPEEMPAQLLAYVSQAFDKSRQSALPAHPKNDNALKKIFSLLRTQTGHDFSQYKPNTIFRRIERRQAINRIESIDKYVSYLQQKPAEIESLFRDLLIGVTGFFRDPEAFKMLEKKIIPVLFANKPEGSAIRVWSVGCATGEEAYSLAILLHEYLEKRSLKYTIQVFATDIDSRAIATARAGLYPAGIAAGISPKRLARYFTAGADGSVYRIDKHIREMLIFSEQNVIKDPPFSRIDLICCRNLLIYLSADLQKRLFPLFNYALNPDGFLFLGSSETVGEFDDLFASHDRTVKLYTRKEYFRQDYRFLTPVKTAVHMAQPGPAGKAAIPRKISLREMTEQALLREIPSVGILVDGHGDVLYIHGRTGRYLEPAPGEAGVGNVLKMAREGLQGELTSALRQAAISRELVRHSGLLVKTNGDFTPANLIVRPLAARPDPEIAAGATPASSDAPSLFLIVIEDANLCSSDQARQKALQGVDEDPGSPKTSSQGKTNAQVAALRQELLAKEEYLQTTNEELRSTNEEMQSINEELQSSNEELETSREEMQSINEELTTTNTELQSKVTDLSRVNNDMNNLLAGTGIATVFVDQGLQILRFTPAATEIINLMSNDIGRPVSHIASNLVGYDGLINDVKSVLDTLVNKEVEVETDKGKWFTLRIQPYRTLENVIEGAVISFIDITEAKIYKETLQITISKLEAVNKELEGFTYLISHDLRTPVRHMNSYTQLLKKDAWSGLNEKCRSYLNTILKASRNISVLIDDLLEFSRIGNTRLKDDAVDLNDIINEARQTLAVEIGDRDIQWSVGDLPVVLGDYLMLQLVLLNLVGNALKFTRSRSPAIIEIGYKEEETEYVFFIRDNGVGFDMKYYNKLFKVFQRLHASEEVEGTGIGLANVERVIKRHSGRVWMEGKVDQGAVVYFSLPKDQGKQDD